jgi:DNA-binding NtrC family response regulator
LKNLVHRLLILGSGADVDQTEVESALGVLPGPTEEGQSEGSDLPLKAAREQFEREYLLHQIDALGGNISKVAAKIGMERTHLYRKLKSLGIDPKRSGSRK